MGHSAKQKLVDAFWNLGPGFQRWADSQLSEKNVTPQRLRLLGVLHERGPQMMSDLKSELGVTATNVTALVDALERDGLVERKAHPTDRRATLIALVSGARCEMAGNCSAYKDRVGELFAALTEIERKELLRLLGKLGEALKDRGIT